MESQFGEARDLRNFRLNFLENAFAGKSILVTGHTGFKGSWLALWLRSMGAHVAGLALDPDTAPSHWDLLALHDVAGARDEQEAPGLSRRDPRIEHALGRNVVTMRDANNGVAAWVTALIGAGITPASQHPNRETRRAIAAMFRRWATRADADGREHRVTDPGAGAAARRRGLCAGAVELSDRPDAEPRL